MTVRLDQGAIVLEGACPVDEAETLLELLLAHPDYPVDASGARHFHTALLQVLLTMNPPIRGLPDDEFHRHWIAPLFTRNHMQTITKIMSNENEISERTE
jgi:hypothetical protein